MTQGDLDNLTLEDFLKTKNNIVHDDSVNVLNIDSARPFTSGAPEFVRGGAVIDSATKKIRASAADGVGYDLSGYAKEAIDLNLLNTKTKLTDFVKGLTKDYKLQQELINDYHTNPIEFLKNLRVDVDNVPSGMPQGWLNMLDNEIENLITTGGSGHWGWVPHTWTTTHHVFKGYVDGIGPEILAVLGGKDMFELIRRTKSANEMKEEGTLRREVKSHEINNKSTKRNYENKFGFKGTKKGDYESSYNEKDDDRNER